MRGHGEEREHPDEKEMIGHHGVHLGQANALDAYTLDELGVAISIEDLSADGGRPTAKVGHDDAHGKADGQKGRNDEGE